MERSANFPGDRGLSVEVIEPPAASCVPLCAAAADIAGGLFCGARIKTLRGERRIEDLRIGDRVLTRDNGYQPLRWCGRTATGAAPPFTRPIRIRKGALGRGMPERVLIVAPGQRFLFGGARIHNLLGTPEVIVAASQMTALRGVAPLPDRPLDFVHLLFDRHELVLAEGAWTESLHLTQIVREWLPAPTRNARAKDLTMPLARALAPPDLVRAFLTPGRNDPR